MPNSILPQDKDWIAFICTDPNLSEKENIRIYGKRGQFFKTFKTYLNLISECHSLSYDALTAHVAFVFTHYLLLAYEQRRNEDDRTFGELFFFMADELEDTSFSESFQIIMTAMLDSISDVFQPTQKQINTFTEPFFGLLPKNM